MTLPPTTPPPERLSLGGALAKVDELNNTVTHLTGVINTERETRRRFRLNLMAILVLSAVSVVGISFAYQAANDAKNVGDTLDDCLIVGGSCFERLARSGQLGSNRLMDFNGCMLLRLPATRDESDVEECRKYADDRFFTKLNEAQARKEEEKK